MLTLSVFAPDLIDFVDVDDADLRTLHIVIRILQEAQNDILDIFTDVSGFGQRGRIGNTKRHIENPGQGSGQKCFA